MKVPLINIEGLTWNKVHQSSISIDENYLYINKVGECTVLNDELGIDQEEYYVERISYKKSKIFGVILRYSPSKERFWVAPDVPDSTPTWFETLAEADEFKKKLEKMII